jgi:hypothetical protein
MKPYLIALAIFLALRLLVGGTWVLFTAIMNMRRAQLAGKLHPKVWWMAGELIGLGVIGDFLLQHTLATVIFLDLPRRHGLKGKYEWFLTDRLQRYIAMGPAAGGWRYRYAANVCHGWLDPYDPQRTHCGEYHG